MGGIQSKTPNQKTKTNHQYLTDVSGFTVVETLIVLAITGVLFVSVVGIVAGRQGKTQFTQAANSIRGEIEQVIGEVQSGYYPGVSAANAGSNKEFVSIGKVMQFGTGLGADPERYSVYSLITPRSATDINAAPVTVVNQATRTTALKYGLVTKWMRIADSGESIGAVGFITYFTERSDNLLYGSQTTQIVPVRSTNLTTADPSSIGSNLVASYANRNPLKGVQICFDGGMGQSALVTIGAAGRSNSVTLAIKNGNNCES